MSLSKNTLKAAAASVAAAFLLSACGSSERIGNNPARMLRTHEQAELLRQIRPIGGGQGLYLLDYAADYHLPRVLAADVSSIGGMARYLGRHDLRLLPGLLHLKSIIPGCSSFFMRDSLQGSLMGRNFDYLSPGGVSDVLVVRTAPAEGYRSLGLASLSLFKHRPGSLSDGVTDLSLLCAAPYFVMDGINEKGFFIGVLYLDGDPTEQHDRGKHNLMTVTAIRLLLDRAATVEEAVGLLGQYNMFAGTSKGSYHFMVGDTTGRHCVLEYVHDGDKRQWRLSPVAEDYVTNFYLNAGWREIGHGYDRYDTLAAHFRTHGTEGSAEEAMRLLQKVSQAAGTRKTSNTQWSAVYLLDKKELRLCVGRNYEKTFRLSVTPTTD